MNANESREEAARPGMVPTSEGGKLCHDAPAGAMDGEFRAALVCRNQELLERLELQARAPERRAPTLPAGAGGWVPLALPWRADASRWPNPLRGRWGRVANRFEVEGGVDWFGAERQAFESACAERSLPPLVPLGRGARRASGPAGRLRPDSPGDVLTQGNPEHAGDCEAELVAPLRGGGDSRGPTLGRREARLDPSPNAGPATEDTAPDEAPAIVVDVPDPRRVRAAIESLGYSVGEANEDGLEEYPSLLDLEAAAGRDRGDSEFLELLESAGFSPLVPGSRNLPAWVDDRDSLTVGPGAIRRAAEESRASRGQGVEEAPGARGGGHDSDADRPAPGGRPIGEGRDHP